MDNDTDDTDDTDEEAEGFSDAEIAEQIAPYLEEVEEDYAAQIDPLAKVFEEKGPSAE